MCACVRVCVRARLQGIVTSLLCLSTAAVVALVVAVDMGWGTLRPSLRCSQFVRLMGALSCVRVVVWPWLGGSVTHTHTLPQPVWAAAVRTTTRL